MNRSKVFVLGGLLSATLLMPALPALADPKGKSDSHERENHGQHKGWEKHQAKKFDHDEHDRRFYRRPDPRQYRRDVRYDNRGHHNKPEIRQDFKDIHGTRKEIAGDRVELRKDHTELRNDRAELRRDLRNGASKTEIMKDRQEIRGDMREISKDRVELRKDQAKLDAQRRELKSDLAKK
jgi:hypothetical protein